MKCSNKHRIHASCFDQLINSGSYTCPLDHKVIIDDDQYAMLRGKVYHMYKNQQIKCVNEMGMVNLQKYRCYDCEKTSYDFENDDQFQICHFCLGVNCLA